MEYNKTIRGKLFDTDLAYIAGLIDGEGCIGIYSYPDGRGISRLHILDITVTNNDPQCHELLEKHFGGKTWKRKQKEEWCLNYQWKIRGMHAKNLLEQILPYLRLKKDQAELGIKFINEKKKYCVKGGNRWGHGLTDEEINKREQFYLKMRILNQRHRNNLRHRLQPQRLTEKTPEKVK